VALQRLSGGGDDQVDLELSIRLNRAAANLKLKQFQDCIDDCEFVLLIDPSRSKAWFRKAEVSRVVCTADPNTLM